MPRYQLADGEISTGNGGFEASLARAHAARSPAICLCTSTGDRRLYITRRQSGYVLARWPGTGAAHAPACDHYDAPDELTGLGQVRDGAMRSDADTGDLHLKLAFPLKRGAARAAPAAITNDKPALKHNGRRLSMRGLLHILWHKAELTHWYPRMAGKRNWWIVRRELLEAVDHCWTRGSTLAPRVFIPEVYRGDDDAGILSRRHIALTPARISPDTMMIVIGEIKTIRTSRYGEAIVLRHLPDWPLNMDVDVAKRFHRRFATEEDLWRSTGDEDHLVLAASFALRASGSAEMLDVALMPVTREWLPYETLDERALLRLAVADQRSFVKGLRVDLEVQRPIASITLIDTKPLATAVRIENGQDAENDGVLQLTKIAGVDHHCWQPGQPLPDDSHSQAEPAEITPAHADAV